jgi:hypothetical protein
MPAECGEESEDAMKYLCLIDWGATNGNDPAQRAMHDLVAELALSGRIIAPSRWQPSAEAVAIHIRNGAADISDGSCPRPAPLAGLCLIEARDLNDAIRVASRLLPAGVGCIELRPLADSQVRAD